jgi:hypothetical protein
MKGGRRIAASLMAAAVVGGTSQLRAQTVSLAISALTADSTSPAPVMTVTGFTTRPEFAPYTLSLAIGLDPQLRNPFFARSAPGDVATFTLDSLMPERTIVYFRARLIDRFGTIVAEANAQHPVRSWLRLVSPLHGPTTVVDTENPRFVWSSPAITFPPGLWQYDLSVFNKRTGARALFQAGLSDTAFTFAEPLEANTSYNWQVQARAVNSTGNSSTTVSSPGTFIIASPNAPTVTLLYQNFPNPFGRGTRLPVTCFWFDLAHPSVVRLTIYDIRQRQVRHLLPGPFGDGVLPIGGYGRERDRVDPVTGCDPRLEWDGRDDNGRLVPEGVYLAVFEGDRTRGSIKIVFKGQ